MKYKIKVINKGWFKKGQPNGKKGTHLSTEARQNLSIKATGRKVSEETRKKLKIASKLHPSPTRFKKGLIPKNKGIFKTPLEGDSICSGCDKSFHWKRKLNIKKNGTYCYQSPPKTCSTKCRYESCRKIQIGIPHPNQQKENCHLWKGGVAELTSQIRNSLKYRNYRRACLKRDHYTCQLCGAYPIKTEMDHITSFARILEFYQIKTYRQAMNCKALWDLSNVRTLCHKCHTETESYLKSIEKHSKV
jgi:5-methylcytosine-specific restriction endonuclease McrA